MFHPISVLKFGGSVLSGPDALTAAVAEVERTLRRGDRVVAVTSAFTGVTARLLKKAREHFGTPASKPLASLLATGESRSAAFLSLALSDAGIETELLDPDRVALRVRGPWLDGELVDVDRRAFDTVLRAASVAVLPGFFGRRRDGSLAVLGRGGSDLTALFLAHRLGARECRLIKDVDGLHSADPASSGSDHLRQYPAASLDELVSMGGGLVQSKAIDFAREHHLEFTIAAPLSNGGTRVGCMTGTRVPLPFDCVKKRDRELARRRLSPEGGAVPPSAASLPSGGLARAKRGRSAMNSGPRGINDENAS